MAKQSPITPEFSAQSRNLLSIVAVFYGVVLSQALTSHDEIVLDFWNYQYSVAFLALILAFSGAAWEYLRLSLNIERVPYNIRWTPTGDHQTSWEEIRFAIDLLTAAGYAVLLIEALYLRGGASDNIWPLFTTLAVVNGLSYLSTRLVGVSWNLSARRALLEGHRTLRWITALGWWPLAVLGSYLALSHFTPLRSTHPVGFNEAFLVAAILLLHTWEMLERKAAKIAYSKANPAPIAESVTPAATS
jgi:hypothetical protein